MIIGLTGRIASGKGEIAEFLKEKGFEYYTISQAVREEASKIKIPITRESLQDVGDLIRKYEGTGGWIKRIIQKINLSKNQVIDGIRNPGEIEELKKTENFVLISVNAAQKIRFERVLNRDKPSDPKDWEGFVKIDERDFEDKSNPNGQQVGKCMNMADYKLENNGTLDELKSKIEELYEKYLAKKTTS